MKASELINELNSIMKDTGEDIEINEYWIRIITGIDITKFLDKHGKPTLKIVGDKNVSSNGTIL